MHACLQISEILQVIFANLTEIKTSSSVRPSYTTLYHLALTCRTFREPALDALWAYIQTPDVLVTCLPQNAQQARTAAGGGMVVSSLFFSLNVIHSVLILEAYLTICRR
jgi:hypothetical protein